MDQATRAALSTAYELYTRANETSSTTDPDSATRPPAFKTIGIFLAIGSGLFIGTSFVLKKYGLLKANEKYNEEAGEGYGYLKNAFWWAGMTLMILGEALNFVAYAFTDAILVTPLGALSVVITTVLSAIFLKERLSMVGKVACFLCIVGSVVIVMNAPEESSVANIQQMQHFVLAPGFLSYTVLVLVGSAILALWAGPRWGKRNMLVYISICSWVGGLSVVATQGLGSAIVAQAQGTQQFNRWFLYVLLVFVMGTLLTEIIYLNKALNLFNAAMVTPTYYVYFTSTTIITSAILFRGFHGTATSITTVMLGFLTICSGVVLLQLSKSAKDVPDAAVFCGDLDQIHTIAEQEQPETEPKADAIRGAAAIVRRISQARQKWEFDELRRLHEDKMSERLPAVSEDGQPTNQGEWEWDGLRRRRTLHGSQRSRAMTSPQPTMPHPPLGMAYFPADDDLDGGQSQDCRPASAGFSSIVGTIRSRARSVLHPGHPGHGDGAGGQGEHSRTHPVPLTEIAVLGKGTDGLDCDRADGNERETPYGAEISGGGRADGTSYKGSGSSAESTCSSGRRVQFGGDDRRSRHGVMFSSGGDLGSAPPTPPLHSARRQFSFQSLFSKKHAAHDTTSGAPDSSHSHSSIGRQHHLLGHGASRSGITSRGYSSPQAKGATEEERLGLVKGRSSGTGPATKHTRRSSQSSERNPGRYGGAGGSEPEYVDDKQRYEGDASRRSVSASSSGSEARVGREKAEHNEDRAQKGRHDLGTTTSEKPNPVSPRSGRRRDREHAEYSRKGAFL